MLWNMHGSSRFAWFPGEDLGRLVLRGDRNGYQEPMLLLFLVYFIEEIKVWFACGPRLTADTEYKVRMAVHVNPASVFDRAAGHGRQALPIADR